MTCKFECKKKRKKKTKSPKLESRRSRRMASRTASIVISLSFPRPSASPCCCQPVYGDVRLPGYQNKRHQKKTFVAETGRKKRKKTYKTFVKTSKKSSPNHVWISKIPLSNSLWSAFYVSVFAQFDPLDVDAAVSRAALRAWSRGWGWEVEKESERFSKKHIFIFFIETWRWKHFFRLFFCENEWCSLPAAFRAPGV